MQVTSRHSLNAYAAQQTLFKRKQRVFQDSMGCLNVLQQTKKKEAEASFLICIGDCKV